MKSLRTIVSQLPLRILVIGVRAYQLIISPLFGQNCRFHPSCSNYFLQSVLKHGAISGTVRGIRRICRCHPFSRGGYDPP